MWALDVVCILHDETTDRYHAAFFEEKPFPGPVESVDQTNVVRLKSKMHHTSGAKEVNEAIEHLEELIAKVGCPEENVWRDPVDWDGEIGLTLMVPNWIKVARESEG
jgi:hypothetical protein